jgi:hypothetical protein
MARNKISYEALGLFISDANIPYSGGVGSHQDHSLINLVQESSFSFSPNTQELPQIGSEDLAARVAVAEPTVNANFTYLSNQIFTNEKKLGFTLGSGNSIFSDYTPSEPDQYNLISVIGGKTEFQELSRLENLTGLDIIGFGNAYLTNYTMNAAVNSLSSISASYECSNVECGVFSGDSTLPSINLNSGIKDTVQLLISDTGNSDGDFFRSDKITLQLDDSSFGHKISGGHLQNFSVSVDIPRIPLYGFGSNYPFNRVIQFPAQGSVSMSLLASDFNTGTLSEIFTNNKDHEFKVNLYPETTNDYSITITEGELPQHGAFTLRDVNVTSGYSDAQSFTTDKAGKLKSFALSPSATMPVGSGFNIKYKLYEGDGVSGTILETGVQSFTVDASLSDFIFNLTGEHYAYKGNQFTFGFQNNGPTDIFGYSGARTDVYAGGRFYSNYFFDTDTDPIDSGTGLDAALFTVMMDQIPLTYHIQGAKMISQNFSVGIGDNMGVDMTFSFPITRVSGLTLTSEAFN